jgi:hypothetical protein
MTPTQRSLKKWRDAGWLVAVVEKWNPYVKVRNDLFGLFDLLAIRGNETVGIQTTTASHINVRVDKIKPNPNLDLWCVGNRRAVVEGWSKRGARGKRKLWECREVWL